MAQANCTNGESRHMMPLEGDDSNCNHDMRQHQPYYNHLDGTANPVHQKFGEDKQRKKALSKARKQLNRTAKRREYAELVEELRGELAPYDGAKRLSQYDLFSMAVDFLESRGTDVSSLEMETEPEQSRDDESELDELLDWQAVDTVGFLLDNNGTIIHALPSIDHCLGHEVRQVRGQGLLGLVHPADQMMLAVGFERVNHSKVVFQCRMVDKRLQSPLCAVSGCTVEIGTPIYRQMRTSLKQLAGVGGSNHQGPLLMFWACPDEAPPPPTAGLQNRPSMDMTLGGTVPPYEVFGLHELDATMIRVMCANFSGCRVGFPPSNSLHYSAMGAMHPDDVMPTIIFHKEMLMSGRNWRMYTRHLTGHGTWANLELLARPCIHRGTGKIKCILSKAYVHDEKGTVAIPSSPVHMNQGLDINPMYFDSEDELLQLIEVLTLESREGFFQRHYERIQAEEEQAILRELSKWDPVSSIKPPVGDDSDPAVQIRPPGSRPDF